MAQQPETQRALFNRAVTALGGKRETARSLGIGERTIRALCSGERNIHDGFLRDIARMLLTRSDECRRLERLLSPAFSGNLTERQQQRPGRRRRSRPQGGE